VGELIKNTCAKQKNGTWIINKEKTCGCPWKEHVTKQEKRHMAEPRKDMWPYEQTTHAKTWR